MRMIIIAVIALLMLGGGGAGAYYYFFSQSAEASAGEVEKGHEAKKKDKHAKKDSHGGGMEFVELDPLILPIVDRNGVSQVVSLVVVIEVSDKAAAEEVQRLTPRLKDAFIQDMYGVLNRYAALKGGVIQVSSIKKRLKKVSDHVLGEHVANDVLLQVVQQRPI